MQPLSVEVAFVRMAGVCAYLMLTRQACCRQHIIFESRLSSVDVRAVVCCAVLCCGGRECAGILDVFAVCEGWPSPLFRILALDTPVLAVFAVPVPVLHAYPHLPLNLCPRDPERNNYKGWRRREEAQESPCQACPSLVSAHLASHIACRGFGRRQATTIR